MFQIMLPIKVCYQISLRLKLLQRIKLWNESSFSSNITFKHILRLLPEVLVNLSAEKTSV